MATPLYMQALDAMQRLQGVPPYDSIDNTAMACEEFANEIKHKFTARTLNKARALLEEELEMAPSESSDPVGITLYYGEQTLAWLTKKNIKASTKAGKKKLKKAAKKLAKADKAEAKAVKHEMLKKAEPEPSPAEAEKDSRIAAQFYELTDKEMPKDPKVQLAMWVELAELNKKVKFLEMEIRKSLSENYFPNPTEGANNVPMDGGYKLTNKHTIYRKCDEAAFDGVFEELPEGSKDLLISFKPELKIREYRKLSDDHKRIFDQCLIIKPGSPELKLVAPKQEK